MGHLGDVQPPGASEISLCRRVGQNSSLLFSGQKQQVTPLYVDKPTLY